MSVISNKGHETQLFFCVCFMYTRCDGMVAGCVSRIVTDNSGTVCDSFEMAKSAPVTARYQCPTVIPAIL